MILPARLEGLPGYVLARCQVADLPVSLAVRGIISHKCLGGGIVDTYVPAGKRITGAVVVLMAADAEEPLVGEILVAQVGTVQCNTNRSLADRRIS